MSILAVDPATRCGWAFLPSAGVVLSGTWDLSVRRDEDSGMRLLRFVAKMNELMKSHGVNVVVYEAARHSAPKMAGALVVQSEIQGVLKLWCKDNRVSYRGYSPSEIKRHATGRGNAPKSVVLASAQERWQDRRIRDDNEADALWLLELARRDIGVS